MEAVNPPPSSQPESAPKAPSRPRRRFPVRPVGNPTGEEIQRFLRRNLRLWCGEPIGFPELLLIRGLPGSGKGAAAKALESIGYVRCEANMYFTRKGAGKYERENIKRAHAYCYDLCRSAMRRRHNVVVANTFVKLWELKPFLILALKYSYSVRIVEAGNPDTEHEYKLSRKVVKGMEEKWERLY